MLTMIFYVMSELVFKEGIQPSGKLGSDEHTDPPELPHGVYFVITVNLKEREAKMSHLPYSFL